MGHSDNPVVALGIITQILALRYIGFLGILWLNLLSTVAFDVPLWTH